MPKTLVARGRIEKGVLRLTSRQAVHRALASWKDADVSVTIEKLYATRSPAQNRYYHSVVVPLVAARLQRPVALAHELLKAQFLPRDTADGRNGFLVKGLVIGGSTTKLDTIGFIDYLEAIVGWAAEHWELYIPDPDPNWREQALAAKAKHTEAA